VTNLVAKRENVQGGEKNRVLRTSVFEAKSFQPRGGGSSLQKKAKGGLFLVARRALGRDVVKRRGSRAIQREKDNAVSETDVPEASGKS